MAISMAQTLVGGSLPFPDLMKVRDKDCELSRRYPDQSVTEGLMIVMVVGVLIGALGGLYFGVVILVPLTIIVLLGTVILDVANGPPLQITLFHMACIWVGLQFAYFGSAFWVSRSQANFDRLNCENSPSTSTAPIRARSGDPLLSKVLKVMES